MGRIKITIDDEIQRAFTEEYRAAASDETRANDLKNWDAVAVEKWD